jgi:hypothetical protein
MASLHPYHAQFNLTPRQFYQLVADGCFAIEDLDLPEIEDVISLGIFTRQEINDYFANGIIK